MYQASSLVSDIMRYFRTYFKSWAESTGLKQNQIAQRLDLGQSQVNEILSGKRGLSIVRMEEIAIKTGSHILEALIKGRYLCGEEIETHKLSANQIKALSAFKECLLKGGEAADMLAENALNLAKKINLDQIEP